MKKLLFMKAKKYVIYAKKGFVMIKIKKIINYEEKEMIRLTDNENKFYEEQEKCHISKKDFVMIKIKKRNLKFVIKLESNVITLENLEGLLIIFPI